MANESRLDVSVVLPTYNESASLPVIVPRIVDALVQAGLHGEVIVVDDASPDRTADVARDLAATLPVRVLERTDERGLATAVIAGFGMSSAEVCVVMDADGSHPVHVLPDMVRMILADKAEIVVGSRHVPGGGSTDWPLFSQLKSRFAASLAFGLSGMTDPTTGYMAVRRTLVERLELDPVGWKIVLETVVKAHPARLAEVPIVFTDRELGESKQSLRVLSQYLEHLYKLYQFRFPTFVELLKFCLVGFLGLLVDLTIVFGLKRAFGMDTRLCQVFGFAAAVTFNYAVNRRFSFAHAREAPLLQSYLAYVGANLVGLTVRMVVIDTLMRMTNLDRGSGYLLLSAIGVFVATLVNFIGVKYFAFAPEAPREGPTERESLPPGVGPHRVHALTVLTLALALLGAASALGAIPRTHDEHVNVVMAENIRQSFDGLVHPSVTPGTPEDWRRDSLPQLGNTPLYPLLLAAVTPLGERGYDALTVALFALFALGGFAALAPIDRSAGRTAVVLLASSPALIVQFSRREFEPLVAVGCLLGFAAAVRALVTFAIPHALLAGAALGLAFVTKMWLFVPGLFACIGLFVSFGHGARSDERQRIRELSLWFAATCALLSASHLLFVAFTAPDDLGAWVEWVYLGLFSGRGVTAPKLSSDGASAHSVWAYLGWLVRDHGALFAPLVLGLPAATRRMGRLRRAFFVGSSFALLGLVPLSVPVAKEPLYMLPVLPFFYGLVAHSLCALDRTPSRYVRVNVGAARASLAVAGLVALATFWSRMAEPTQPLLVSLLSVGSVLVWCTPSLRVLSRRSVGSTIVPCALASIALASGALLARPLGLV
jgi:dolichol-phosphate mannosyltransferase